MRSRYHWDHLFCNKVFTLHKYKDYDCSQSSICQQVRNAASQRGLSIEIFDSGAHVEVYVMSIDPETKSTLFT